jgi:uncharacterized protein YeeX (DUF496 family)
MEEKNQIEYDKPKHQNLVPYNLKCKHLQKQIQIIQKFPQIFCKHMQIEDFLLMLDSFNDSYKKKTTNFLLNNPKIVIFEK